MHNKIYSKLYNSIKIIITLVLKNYVNFETLVEAGSSVRIMEEGKLQIMSNVKQLNWNVMFENKL